MEHIDVVNVYINIYMVCIDCQCDHERCAAVDWDAVLRHAEQIDTQHDDEQQQQQQQEEEEDEKLLSAHIATAAAAAE